jgi:long-chain fatty acid transport protein
MFFNPAAIGRFDRSSVQLEASGVLTSLELEDADGATGAGVPIGGEDSQGDVADDAIIPSFYGVAVPHEDFRLGLAINVPFGLGTEYPDGWVGRYHTLESSFVSVNINPVLAYKPANWLTVAGGVQFQWSEAELKNAVDFGTLGAISGIPGSAPTAQDGRAKVKGDGWGYGFNLGALAEPLPGTRLGIAYRSSIDTELEGDARFDLDDAGVGAAIRGATGAFTDVDAETDIELPPMLSFGVHQDLGEQFSVMAEAQWTGWSTFDNLIIDFDNPAQPNNVTEFQWDDQWFFAVGGTWRPNDRLTLRIGGAYDQSPTKDRYRTPRIPDADRYWLSAGIGWQVLDSLSFDLAYSYIFFDEADVRLSADDRGNALRGDLRADYQNQIHVLSLAARWRF